MPNKRETFRVEGDNAELHHYLARLGRRSRCFSRCFHALRRPVPLFVYALVTFTLSAFLSIRLLSFISDVLTLRHSQAGRPCPPKKSSRTSATPRHCVGSGGLKILPLRCYGYVPMKPRSLWVRSGGLSCGGRMSVRAKNASGLPLLGNSRSIVCVRYTTRTFRLLASSVASFFASLLRRYLSSTSKNDSQSCCGSCPFWLIVFSSQSKTSACNGAMAPTWQ